MSKINERGMGDALDRYLENGDPAVIFHRDMLDFSKDLRMSVALCIEMADRGYSGVRNPHDREWVAGSFRTHTAFVSRDVPEGLRICAVRRALESRQERPSTRNRRSASVGLGRKTKR